MVLDRVPSPNSPWKFTPHAQITPDELSTYDEPDVGCAGGCDSMPALAGGPSAKPKRQKTIVVQTRGRLSDPPLSGSLKLNLLFVMTPLSGYESYVYDRARSAPN
jgi:hypothetical protein